MRENLKGEGILYKLIEQVVPKLLIPNDSKEESQPNFYSATRKLNAVRGSIRKRSVKFNPSAVVCVPKMLNLSRTARGRN